MLSFELVWHTEDLETNVQQLWSVQKERVCVRRYVWINQSWFTGQRQFGSPRSRNPKKKRRLPHSSLKNDQLTEPRRGQERLRERERAPFVNGVVAVLDVGDQHVNSKCVWGAMASFCHMSINAYFTALPYILIYSSASPLITMDAP